MELSLTNIPPMESARPALMLAAHAPSVAAPKATMWATVGIERTAAQDTLVSAPPVCTRAVLVSTAIGASK